MAFLGGGVYVLRPHVHKKITNWAKGNIDECKKLQRKLRRSKIKDTIAIQTKLNKLQNSIKNNEIIIRYQSYLIRYQSSGQTTDKMPYNFRTGNPYWQFQEIFRKIVGILKCPIFPI